MKDAFDLNVAPLEMYPILKVLTRSDMTTSQLVLPRHAVEEHIILNLSDALRNRLLNEDGRANVWVVDDEMCKEYFLTIVDREHRYSVISWGHVLRNRMLNEGQTIRFGWMLGKLHFVVCPENARKPGERTNKDIGNHKSHRDKRLNRSNKNQTTNKMRQNFGGGSSGTYCDLC